MIYKMTNKAAGTYLFSKNTGKILLLFRSEACSDPNTWSIITGIVDEGESFEEAAKREIQEELNYSEDINLYKFTEDIGKYDFESYIAFVDDEIDFDIDLSENTQAKWFSKQEFYELDNKHWGFNAVLEDESSKIIFDSFLK